MKIYQNSRLAVQFDAFVNEGKNGKRWLSQKGSYIWSEKGEKITGIDDETYYTISGKGINQEYLSQFKKGEKVKIAGYMYAGSIKEATWDNGTVHYTIVLL